MAGKPQPLRDPRLRIEEKTDTSGGPDACHVWTGTVNNGRPAFTVRKRNESPRRLVWEWTFGEKPHADRRVWVTCGNRFCLNPKHLRCETYEERFWSFVDKSAGPDACWPWTGARLKGYGQFRRDGNRRVATRLAWEYVTGSPLPDGMLIMHTCDNPPCTNPAHLRPGTNADNIADMWAKGRGSCGEKHRIATKGSLEKAHAAIAKRKRAS